MFQPFINKKWWSDESKRRADIKFPISDQSTNRSLEDRLLKVIQA